MLRLGELPHSAARSPRRWHHLPVHLDPDLRSSEPTYGDNCRTAGRAFSLRRAQPGDLIVFLARLKPQAAPPVFALVGRLEVAEIRPDLAADPGPGWWDSNAHVRRARATGAWDLFWIFRGGPASGLLERAVVFERGLADEVFERAWSWRSHRTELQTIGSYTRAVRRLTGTGASILRRLVT
jgi:hypothetical protein